MFNGRREYRGPRPGEIASFLATHADEIKTRGHDELRFRRSPCCDHNKPQNMSCQINTKSGLWRCFACDKRGNWFTLTREFDNPLPAHDRFLVAHEIVVDRSWINMFKKDRRTPVSEGKYPRLLDYCKSMRGLDEATLDAWRVSSQGDSNLRWPIYAWIDDQWQMVNTRNRACLNREAAKTRDWFGITGGPTSLLIGNHLLDINDPTKRAIIFEGQWDAMAAYQIGLRNVFSLPNGANNVKVSEMLRYIPDEWEIWLAMDMDSAGDRAVENFFAQLGVDRTARLVLPHKDLNDWLLANPELTPYEVEQTARGMTESLKCKKVDGYMNIDLNEEDQVHQVNILCSTPWLGLTNILGGGLREAETTGILAPSGKGKTTLVNQMAVHAARGGVRAGIISLEGARESLKQKIKSCIRGTVPADEQIGVLSKLCVSPLWGRKTTAPELLLQVEKFCEEGCKLIVIDNLDFALEGNSSQKIETYGAIIDMMQSYLGHALVVWQPNKIQKDSMVNSGNQKGYSQALQDADNYMSLNALGNSRLIEVEKVRETGIEGTEKIWLDFDQVTKSYKQCKAPLVSGGGPLDL